MPFHPSIIRMVRWYGRRVVSMIATSNDYLIVSTGCYLWSVCESARPTWSDCGSKAQSEAVGIYLYPHIYIYIYIVDI